jgi:hypothetical protein
VLLTDTGTTTATKGYKRFKISGGTPTPPVQGYFHILSTSDLHYEAPAPAFW